MLRINIPSNGPSNITFSTFDDYGFPHLPNGMDSEINNDVILLFDDEEQAIVYAKALLKELSENTNNDSPQRKAGNEIIEAIDNDEFVRTYRG
jgi:hypothetical protein